MKITNKLGLPLPIVEAVKNKQYDPGESDITTTSLIGPVQIAVLKKRYDDVLEEDVIDRIYALQGESVHTILERAAAGLEDYIVEKRFYYEYEGWKLGGQIDVFDKKHGMLQDYKVTSVYAVKDGAKEEHVKQANINAYILRKNGFEVKGLQVVAILRDWSKLQRSREEQDSKAKGFKCRYPEHQVVVLPVPMLSDDKIEAYIHERMNEHKEAHGWVDEALPECSKEDRWAKDDIYAVMKSGGKRAVKLCSDESSAKLYIDGSGKSDLRTVKQPGVNTRCEHYCPVKYYCKQYAKMKGDKE